MAQCEVCGNDYYLSFEVVTAGNRHVFDCFECAIHRLAPVCAQCGVKIVGHGIEAKENFFCCANCAKQAGVQGVADHIWGRERETAKKMANKTTPNKTKKEERQKSDPSGSGQKGATQPGNPRQDGGRRKSSGGGASKSGGQTGGGQSGGQGGSKKRK